MEGWITEALKQVPGLAILVVLTVYFLRAIKEQRESFQETETKQRDAYLSTLSNRDNEFAKVVRESNDSNNAVHNKCIESMDKNTLMLGRMEKCLESALQLISQYDNGEDDG